MHFSKTLPYCTQLHIVAAKTSKVAEHMDALQKPDRDTLIEQSVKWQNTVIKQHFA